MGVTDDLRTINTLSNNADRRSRAAATVRELHRHDQAALGERPWPGVN
jgi:hypothetical protein